MKVREPNNMRARIERSCRALLSTNHVAVVNINPSGRQGMINWKNCKNIPPARPAHRGCGVRFCPPLDNLPQRPVPRSAGTPLHQIRRGCAPGQLSGRAPRRRDRGNLQGPGCGEQSESPGRLGLDRHSCRRLAH